MSSLTPKEQAERDKMLADAAKRQKAALAAVLPILNSDRLTERQPIRTYPNSQLVKYDLNGWDNADWLAPSVKEMAYQTQWFLNDLKHRHFGKAKPHWLTLIGQSGCGKTHLALAIRDRARELMGYTQYTAQKWGLTTYADRMRNKEYEFNAYLKDLPLLILDDLGAERSTPYIIECLYSLLNDRLGKWTVITSNLSVAEIAAQMGERIASRLHRGHNIIVESHDADDYCYHLKTNPA